MSQDYTTWENDFLSDVWELRDSDGELIASVEPFAEQWLVKDRDGLNVGLLRTLPEAKKRAQSLV